MVCNSVNVFSFPDTVMAMEGATYNTVALSFPVTAAIEIIKDKSSVAVYVLVTAPDVLPFHPCKKVGRPLNGTQAASAPAL